MIHAPTSATLELLAWISSRRATYAEAIEVWRSTCPRHTVWEDAFVDGLVRVVQREVVLTPLGREVLQGAMENGRLTAGANAAVASTDAR